MADTHDTTYLSIGEVLGLLLEEFPDVTISKIRFLESQGLISPERTPSGYRKFYDDDVQLLRVILAEQRQNYLPLRVIKDRLQTGEIDPTGEHLRPNGDSAPGAEPGDPGSIDTDGDGLDDPEPSEVPQASIAAHPAARHQPAAPEPTTRPAHTDGDTTDGDTTDGDTTDGDTTDRSTPDLDVDGNDGIDLTAAARLLPGVLLDRGELCAMVGMTDGELTELETFGVVSPRDSSPTPIYGDDAVEIAKPACEFLRAGVDARHLRNWRTSAEREASLFEQLVTPRFRQRNPEARAEALDQLRRLDGLGAQLRAALTRHALRQHFDT